MFTALSAIGASAEPGAFLGAGTLTCSQYTQLSRESPKEVQESTFGWALGFMSGLNAAAYNGKGMGRDLTSMSNDLKLANLQHYCDQHPADTYVSGVIELYKLLKPISVWDDGAGTAPH